MPARRVTNLPRTRDRRSLAAAAPRSMLAADDSPPASARLMLSGRPAECATLERLLEATRAGQSAVLVLRGEAGIGKSARWLMPPRAPGLPHRPRHRRGVGDGASLAGVRRFVRAAAQKESSGCHDRSESALATAAGLSGGDRPDRFLVGLAVLSLLSDAAEAQPLVALIDDAQWLDRSSAQVLAFVARRLEAESVLFLFAEREPNEPDGLAGLPVLPARRPVGRQCTGTAGLGDKRTARRARRGAFHRRDTRQSPLHSSRSRRGCRPGTRGRVRPVDRATAAGPDGGALPPEGGTAPRRGPNNCSSSPRPSRSVTRHSSGVPPWNSESPTRPLNPSGSRVCSCFGTRVTFRHPLLRSAIYRAASSGERRGRASDPGRRNRSGAPIPIVGPGIARTRRSSPMRTSLASWSGRPGGRMRAAGWPRPRPSSSARPQLTVDPARRAGRALAAAQANHQAGAPEVALALLASAHAGALDPLERAQAKRLRAQIAFTSNRGRDAPGAPAGCGQTARAARRDARARDVSGRAGCRTVRGSSHSRRRAARGRGRARRTPVTRATRARPAPRRQWP